MEDDSRTGEGWATAAGGPLSSAAGGEKEAPGTVSEVDAVDRAAYLDTRFPLVALTALRRLERGDMSPLNQMGVVVPWNVVLLAVTGVLVAPSEGTTTLLKERTYRLPSA